MPYDFVNKVEDLKKVLRRFLRLNRVLDLLIVFLACYALMIVFLPDYSWASGIIALLIILAYSLKHRVVVNAVILIEEAYPTLRHRLSAAYDNQNLYNVVLEDLSTQVSNKLDDVSYSPFFPTGSFLKRVIVIVLLCFVVVSLAFADVSMPLQLGRTADVPLVVDGVVDMTSLNRLLGGGERDIFGVPDVATLEGDDVTLTVYRGVGSELNIREINEPSPAFETAPLFPVMEETAPLYVEEPIKHQEIVKKYFIKLSKSDIQ